MDIPERVNYKMAMLPHRCLYRPTRQGASANSCIPVSQVETAASRLRSAAPCTSEMEPGLRVTGHWVRDLGPGRVTGQSPDPAV